MLNYQKYNLLFVGAKVEHIELEYPEQKKLKTFIRPSTLNNLPKLYLVKHKSKIIYVGITTQSITNRLKQGLNASGKYGYHGYKWKQLGNVTLHVFFFNNDLERAETVEAEVVYLIRRNTGFWPEYQNEIHFHFNATDQEKRMAEFIYKKVQGE